MPNRSPGCEWRKANWASEGKHIFLTKDRQFASRVVDFLTIYPEVETLSEEELDDSPWACSIEVSGSHVIMAILPEHSEKVVPQVLALAEENGLVCFDAQAGQVYLPPHLVAKQSDAAPATTSSAQAEPKRSDPPAILGTPVPDAS